MALVKAVLATVLTAIIFLAGLVIVSGVAGARATDLLELLSTNHQPFRLLCFLAAWGSIALGGLSLLMAFLAFIAPDEEEDDPRLHRRRFPKAAPMLLVALALALAFIALRCAAAAVVAPVVTPVVAPVVEEPETVEPAPLAAPIIEEEPGPEPRAAQAPVVSATPLVYGEASDFEWLYTFPIPGEGRPAWSSVEQPFADDAEARRLLCGKAWVAVTGSASEEGERALNQQRARLRTERAMTRAANWIAAHPECGQTPVLGINLGQHVREGDNGQEGGDGQGDGDGPEATAYQRQVLTVGRALGPDETALTAAQARREASAFINDPAAFSAFLGRRRFQDAPTIIEP